MNGKIKLAVRKEPGIIPGSGFHYMLFPMAMQHDFEAACFQQMGYIVIEVPETEGKALLEAGRAALRHQMEIAVIADSWEKLQK